MRARTAAVIPLAVRHGGGATADASGTDLRASDWRPPYFGKHASVEDKGVVDQRTRACLPAAWVSKVVRTFNGEFVVTTATAMAISADPSFRFFFKPQAGGSMTAEMTAAKDREFSHSCAVDGAVAATAVH